MAYNLFPAVDDNYNFPPEVRAALALATELRNQVVPMTQAARNALTGAALWDGRLIANTTTDRINRYDAGTTTWVAMAELPELTTGLATERALSGMRNRIINGAFNVNQRAAVSGAALSSGGFFFDRWQATTAGSPTWVADSQGAVVTLPSAMQMGQTIAQENLPPGRYVLSHAGTAKARVYKIGDTPPAFATTPFTFDTANPSVKDLTIEFQADGGSSKTVSRVQFEQIGAAGTAADLTPFERRMYGAELALCQRYYWRFAPNNAGVCLMAPFASTLTARTVLKFPVPMRVSPSFTMVGVVTAWQVALTGSTGTACSSVTMANSTLEEATISFILASAGLTPGNCGHINFAGTPFVSALEFKAESGLGL
jgi:hypothetical protein